MSWFSLLLCLRKSCSRYPQSGLEFGMFIPLMPVNVALCQHAKSNKQNAYDLEHYNKHILARLTCQPATRSTGQAKQGPEGLRSNTNWTQPGRAGYILAMLITLRTLACVYTIYQWLRNYISKYVGLNIAFILHMIFIFAQLTLEPLCRGRQIASV